MRVSLRNAFGYTTILAIIMAIVRRPAAYYLNNADFTEFGQAFCVPFYPLLYIFNLESLWFFTRPSDTLLSRGGTVVHDLPILLFICLGSLVVIGILGLVTNGLIRLITYLFFPASPLEFPTYSEDLEDNVGEDYDYALDHLIGDSVNE